MTSNHLATEKYIRVSIIKTPGNTTAYHIENTQGAEYGDEAEKIRDIMEKAINEALGLTPDAECSGCDWKGMRDEMPEDDGTDVCPLCGSDDIYYNR